MYVKNLVYIQGSAKLVHSEHEMQSSREFVKDTDVLRNFIQVELLPSRGNSISKGSEMDINANKGYL